MRPFRLDEPGGTSRLNNSCTECGGWFYGSEISELQDDYGYMVSLHVCRDCRIAYQKNKNRPVTKDGWHLAPGWKA
jgi:hypothetical protein